jgi:tetratricopeptide (TPR) repeat protein
LVVLLGAIAASAQSPPTEEQARQAFKEAGARYHATGSPDENTACGLAKAAYDLTEFLEESRDRDQITEAGLAASRQAVASNPDSAAAHYYLALNLGAWAKGRKLGALRIVPEIEREFLASAGIDPRFDYAGAHRALGLLYLQAPGWPLSVGNRNKARKHLSNALELAPEYPGNHIALLEFHAKQGEPKNLESGLETFEKLLPKARSKFSGAGWETSWKEWDAKLARLEKTLARVKRNPPISPASRGARQPRP